MCKTVWYTVVQIYDNGTFLDKEEITMVEIDNFRPLSLPLFWHTTIGISSLSPRRSTISHFSKSCKLKIWTFGVVESEEISTKLAYLKRTCTTLAKKNRYSREIHEVDLQFGHVTSSKFDLRFDIDVTGTRGIRVESSDHRSESILHDRTWLHCESISWISRL